VRVHVAPAATVPSVMLSVVAPAAGLHVVPWVSPQPSEVGAGGSAAVSPPSSADVIATPEIASVAATVNRSVDASPGEIAVLSNTAVNAGGAAADGAVVVGAAA
jgi:hypothetical protein